MIADTLRQYRQILHVYPELSGQEIETADLIRSWIMPTGPDRFESGIGGHGILAIYGRTSAPLILFRAELDALPIPEVGQHPYTSARKGISHACGHDGHMSILLGLALAWKADPVPGIRMGLLFQPAEETGEGAARMLNDQRITSLDPLRIYAVHHVPGYPEGSVLIREGRMTPAVHTVRYTFSGQASHAAEPHLGRSPNPVIARILQEAEDLTRPDRTQQDFQVVTPVMTRIGHEGYGTTPADGEIHLTLRAGDEHALANVQKELDNRVRSWCETEGLTWSRSLHEPFPASVNHPEAVAEAIRGANAAGLNVLHQETPFPWGEDFGHFLTHWPGALIGLGSGVDRVPLHHPASDFPDDLIMTGLRFFRSLLETPARS